MTNYRYRKYEGAPHSEKKKLPPEEPSKLAPRGSKPDKKTVVITDFWHVRPKKHGKWGRWSWGKKVYIPCCGREFGTWNAEFAADHVLKRMKCNLVIDKALGVYWVQEHSTKNQVSPEFSNYDCLINWLIYKGLEDRWLHVASHIWRRKNQVQAEYHCRLEKT
jgi:hypothetical protein